MGLADLVQAEETVSIKISEYRKLIENNTELDMLRQVSNGTAPEVYVRILRKGAEAALSDADREELEAYRATGITPDRFHVIDEEYRKLSKDNARLTEEKAQLFDQVKTLEQKCEGLEEPNHNYRLDCERNQGLINSMGDQIADLKGSNSDLREQLRSKFEEVEELCSTIQEKTAQIDELESAVKSKQEYIEALEARVRRGMNRGE